ncbi:hypothetical protein ACWGNE_27525 [Streptomyces xiamenensis]
MLKRRLSVLTAMLATLAACLLTPLTTSSAVAAPSGCPKIIWQNGEKTVSYENCGGGSQEESDNGGGERSGNGTPSCDLSAMAGQGNTRWCEGTTTCWAHIPSSVYKTQAEAPEQPPPSEDAVYIFKWCVSADGESSYDWMWYTPDEISLEELAWQAYGRLTIPAFTLEFNPPQKAVIFIDTWWWASGTSDEVLTGSSAAGLVAIADPDRMEVDPGDGSGVMSCPFSTTKSDACAYTYERASDGYPARARLVYTVRFENNGAPLEVPGLPGAIESEWQEVTVPVTEVQASVVG